MNGSEIADQLRHMQEFIALEAREKVEEIDSKAEEEFEIEKSRLLSTEVERLNEMFQRREKQLTLAKKILDSNLANQSRLKVLESRNGQMSLLKEETISRLFSITKKSVCL
uniref:V-type proton ATPase subunit E n=1 Tax=Lepeophtheirus salmonis TaxID=72036 RepID=D3PII8_LEPSM|nr:V-type proton ATPase subunit E [Lepeophtheirus salmonis]